MNYREEYRNKLRTPEEAVRVVKSGDWVDYTVSLGFAPLLDAPLAARRDELHDVKIRGNLLFGPIRAAECSEVDYVVEGEHGPLPQVRAGAPTETDRRIAGHILPYIRDRAIRQLGIGSMPTILGQMLAQSDLKDLGMHTELCTDAYADLYYAGKLTNRYKKVFPGKGVAGFAFGTDKLYERSDPKSTPLRSPVYTLSLVGV